MTSLRLRLLRGAMRHVVKPLLKRTSNAALMRAALNIGTWALWLPRGVVQTRDAHGVTWFHPKGGPKSSRLVLWFHGGAYVAGGAFSHRSLLGRIAKETGCPVAAPDYRLAPKHPLPAAFEDAVSIFSTLGHDASDVILGGDSAGGGLATALAARLIQDGQMPAGLVLLSPWTDLTVSGASILRNRARDPLIPSEAMPKAIAQIAPGADLTDPRLSPIFAKWDKAPEAFLQVGSTEVLLDDSLRLAENLRAAGAKVEVDTIPGAPHVIAFLAPVTPEGRGALDRVVRFIQDRLSQN